MVITDQTEKVYNTIINNELIIKYNLTKYLSLILSLLFQLTKPKQTTNRNIEVGGQKQQLYKVIIIVTT